MNAMTRTIMPEHDSHIAELVRAELESADWRLAKGWENLAKLADVVNPTSIVVYTEAMSVQGKLVVVPADLSVHFIYKVTGDENGEEFDQNFPTTLRFEIADDKAKLIALEADLSSES